jgi:hypothetical protein
MSAQLNSVAAEFNSAVIVDNYDLAFDPGDKRNGSLYLCTPRSATETAAQSWIAALQAAGLWSDTPHKSVPDEQRQAYKDGLIFVAAIAYRVGLEHIVIARFDHPKFPSDSRRWEAWVDFLDARHERCR